MTPLEIIEKFADYVDYRVDQTHYVVDSRHFRMSMALEKLPRLQEYDPTGKLALLYVKRCFAEELEHTSVSLRALVDGTADVRDDISTWEMFCGQEFEDVLSEISDIMSTVLARATATPTLDHNSEAFESAMLNATQVLVDDLGHCHEHVWATNGEPMTHIDTISSRIRVFDSASDMLAHLLSEPPCITLAYVRQRKSTDSFFGIFASQDGNVFSLDDFIPEAYPLQHEHHRNGRYLEAKAFDLFPYNDMVHMSEPDYKGWFKNYEVGDDIDMLSMPPRAYIPLVLALMCVNNIIDGKLLYEAERLYISAPAKATTDELPAPKNMALVRAHQELATLEDVTPLVNLSTQNVLDGTFANGERAPFIRERNFGNSVTKYDVCNEIVADNAGTFALSGELYQPRDEFIGTASTIGQCALHEGRLQLARHLLDTVKAELEAYGGIDSLWQWFRDECDKHRNDIVELCISRYIADQDILCEDDISYDAPYSGILYYGDKDIPLRSVHRMRHMYGATKYAHPLNKFKCNANYYPEHLLSEDGKRCALVFAFAPQSHEDLRAVFGDDIPRPLEWWTLDPDPFGYPGNCLLELTDPVLELRHPLAGYSFECDFRGIQSSHATNNSFRPFAQIGFTKREIKALVKKRENSRYN